MNVSTIDALLERLNGGDHVAAEQAFVAYEPYLRKVVRRLLPSAMRSKFDSIDIVQSVYGDVLVAFRSGGMRFGTSSQLSAFLIKATRNRFIDRVRRYQTSARLEQPLGESEPRGVRGGLHPHPSDCAVGEELWERLLALCPPEHQRLLQLRKSGFSASEIAAQVGIHEGSVRRVLRDLSVRLACDQAPREIKGGAA